MSVKLLKMCDESMIQNFSSLVKINNRDLLSDWRACSLDILMVRVNLMNRARVNLDLSGLGAAEFPIVVGSFICASVLT